MFAAIKSELNVVCLRSLWHRISMTSVLSVSANISDAFSAVRCSRGKIIGAIIRLSRVDLLSHRTVASSKSLPISDAISES